jgi:hypothetical protein
MVSREWTTGLIHGGLIQQLLHAATFPVRLTESPEGGWGIPKSRHIRPLGPFAMVLTTISRLLMPNWSCFDLLQRPGLLHELLHGNRIRFWKPWHAPRTLPAMRPRLPLPHPPSWRGPTWRPRDRKAHPK